MPAAHPPNIRTRALELYAEHGPTRASELVETETGHRVGASTITGWAKSDGIRTVRNERNAAAVEAARLRWAERRTALVHDLGEIGALAVARARQELRDGSVRDAKDAMTAAAIAVDKAELLDLHDDPEKQAASKAKRDELLADARRHGRHLQAVS